MFKVKAFRGGKYTEKEFSTEEKARAYANNRKQGVIVLAKGIKWRDGSTTWMNREVLKGEPKTIEKERDDFFCGKRIVGKTLDEYFGNWYRRCDRYVVTIDDHSMMVHKLDSEITNIKETDSGFVVVTEYTIRKNYLVITKNEMMEYGFDDFFEHVSMTDEEERILRGLYGTAYKLTKPLDWDEWNRYEAMCGGDYHEV